MPIRYDRDDTRRLVVLTVTGSFDRREFEAAMARHTEEDAWTYAVLWDLRQMEGRPTLTDLQAFREQYVDDFPDVAERGPVALLVEDGELYRAACQHLALVGSRIAIDVFPEKHEALEWLERRSKRPGH